MDEQVARIQHNIAEITERIERAAQAASRPAGQVRLVVVTKSQPVEVVRAAVEAGASILGENYPQESLPKILALPKIMALPKIQTLPNRPEPSDTAQQTENQAAAKPAGPAWHMIGHLQSRKASIVADHFDMLQSLDSLQLAQRLERLLGERDRVLPVLLELNVGGEESKYGWPAWADADLDGFYADIDQIMAMPHLAVSGLMTMPPLYDDPDKTRPFFARLRKISEALAKRLSSQYFTELSMGTSADFEAAVMEGATLVRVGTAILGARIPKAQL